MSCRELNTSIGIKYLLNCIIKTSLCVVCEYWETILTCLFFTFFRLIIINYTGHLNVFIITTLWNAYFLLIQTSSLQSVRI